MNDAHAANPHPHPAASLDEMLAAITKTFVISHEGSSDEHLAQTLVYNAGRLAWRLRETGGLETQTKTNTSDIVTRADKAAETFVTSALDALRPEDGYFGEEGAKKEGTSGRTWVIDPIDGTWNFASGLDYFCSALALVSGNPNDPDTLHFGAVHRPAMGYTWFGGPDIPTTRDGRALEQLPEKPASQVALATYLHPTFLGDTALVSTWLNVLKGFATVRSFGAGSVDLASVADGSLGAWMQHSVPAWDWLPGRALIEGVGGHCATVEAGGKTWSIAANPQTLRDLRELLDCG